MGDNMGGIASMLANDDFKCLLGDPHNSQCRQPDVILVQSAFHDMNNDFTRTEEAMSQVFQQLRDAKKRGSAVYWMASTDYHNNLDGGLRELNAVASRLSREHHPTIQFIDRAQSASRFYNAFHDNDIVKSLNLFGHSHHHIGAIEFREHYDLKKFVLSSYLTQDLLSHICG